METITSKPAVDPTHLGWQQEFHERALQSSCNLKIVFQSLTPTKKIANDQDVRKVTVSKALDSLDVVKCFTEIHGGKQKSVMVNKLIGKVETLKL